MSKTQKTIIERLDEMIAFNDIIANEVKLMHKDVKELLTILIEKERPVNVEVKTSTAEEVKEALSPLIKEVARLRR